MPTYDVKIATTMNGVDAERRVPPLWLQFDALRAKPVMVIRGANSDLLTAETVEAMRARRESMDVLEVPDQGHAPLLTDADTIGRIWNLCTAAIVRCISRNPESKIHGGCAGDFQLSGRYAAIRDRNRDKSGSGTASCRQGRRHWSRRNHW